MKDLSPLPLAETRVLDFSQIVMGPVATQTLADFGADVLKIERPGVGDIFRRAIYDSDKTEHAAFGSVNCSKRSVSLDISSESGRKLIYDLVKSADVVVNNFRPGVMDRLELGYERLSEINPRIIFAQGTGFGIQGRYRNKGSQDIVAQALTGAMLHKPDPSYPTEIYPIALSDYTAGMHMVQGILLALITRERTGLGQQVNVCLYDSMLAMMTLEASMRLTQNVEHNWTKIPLLGTFSTSDGEIVLVGAFRPNPLRDICVALELEDLSLRPEFAKFLSRIHNRAELHDILSGAFAKLTTEEALSRLEAQDVLCAEVRTMVEALDDPHTARIVDEIPRPGLGPLRTIGSPVGLSQTPAAARKAPPRQGEGADEALAAYGISPERIAELRNEGVLD